MAYKFSSFISTIWPLLLGLAGAALLPFAVDYYVLTLLAIYAILALSLGFIWGFSGILCFGQAAFFGIGAYAFAIIGLNFGDPWAALLGAVVTAGLAAAIVGIILFYGRLTDVYLAVVTLVVSLLLFKFINATAGAQWVIGNARLGGFNGIPAFPTLYLPLAPNTWLLDGAYYSFVILLAAICYLFCRFMLASKVGRITVAISHSDLRMQLLGYDTRHYKIIFFAIGGAIAGLAGALYANWAEIVTPALFALGQSAEIIIWVIVGGVGTLIGPMLGAVILGYLKFLLGSQSLLDNSLIIGILLILVVLMAPRGLLPIIMRWVTKIFSSNRPRKRRRLTSPSKNEGGSDD